MMQNNRYADIISYNDYPVKGAVKHPTINKRWGINEIPATLSSKNNDDGDDNRTATRQIHIAVATSNIHIVWQGLLYSPHQLGTGKLPPTKSTGVKNQGLRNGHAPLHSLAPPKSYTVAGPNTGTTKR